MPRAGLSVDRRTFENVKANMSEEAVKGLVCMCCARVSMSGNAKANIAFIRAISYFGMLRDAIFHLSWCF